MSATIMINGITCYGYHGALPEEQILGQEFRVDLELSLDTAAPERDLLSETVDYRLAVDIVRRIMEGPPRRLLETLVEEMAADILALSGVKEVKISLCKIHPPIPAVKDGVAVVISRGKE